MVDSQISYLDKCFYNTCFLFFIVFLRTVSIYKQPNTIIMDEKQVEKIVNSEIKKFIADSLDKEVKKILHSSNSQTREELINTIKNAMEAVYKMLWVKKDFWKSDIR